MLVLSRKPNESLVIGSRGIRITVLSCRSGRVRLGIEAPDDVPVHREELAATLQMLKPNEFESDGGESDKGESDGGAQRVWLTLPR